MLPRPVFFVHVMKTAGTAVSKRLRASCPGYAAYPVLDGNASVRKLRVDLILERDPQERKCTRFYTVHMPAWVADEVAPDHLHVSLLREPVARTVSHVRHIARALDVSRLEDIYDEPEWRSRLANYQTRMFSLRRIDWDRLHTLRKRRLREAMQARKEVAPTPPGSNPWGVFGFYTAMHYTSPLDENDYSAAVRMIDNFELVGITEKLDEFLLRLEELTGEALGRAERVNAAPGRVDVSPALLERIRRDNALDLRLYGHVYGQWT